MSSAPLSRKGPLSPRWSDATLALVLLASSSPHALAFTPTSLVPRQPFALSHSRISFVEYIQSPPSKHGLGGWTLYSSFIESEYVSDDEGGDDEEDEDEELEPDPYTEKASSEFLDDGSDVGLAPVGLTSLDWGGAYGALRERVGDIESGRTGPSNALFRLMSKDTPNEAIGKFVSEANPQVVQAMSGAVGSLLGGLSNPAMGAETIVKANGEKLGNLCFQLQMTGYMFRNAEYVLALKEIMDIRGSATVEEYREAFEKIDSDGSGYIESGEVEALLDDVYDGKTPAFEVQTFLQFFDSNNDGRISWDEFEKGLGAVYAKKAEKDSSGSLNGRHALPGDGPTDDDDDDDVDFDDLFGEPSISGTIEVELKNGKVIEVEAEKYISDLKREAEALKEALRQEKSGGRPAPGGAAGPGGIVPGAPKASEEVGGIGGYIASLQGDVKSLTAGISPEVVDAMKMLIEFVLEGGPKGKSKKVDKNADMEIPGSALQQLALWQLVLGYRLREMEATGDYRKLLES